MQFTHPFLITGFLIVLGPLLIHLINLMRHQRVKWAAMDFLLQAYKKHRKWIWLKQLLLLLMRMAAIALIVAMLAQLRTHDQWLSMFGEKTTHHYVLVDDSYSMSERISGSTAFDKSLQTIARIGAQLVDSETSNRFTLLRLSKAERAVTEQDAAGTAAGPSAENNAETSAAEATAKSKSKSNAADAKAKAEALMAQVADLSNELVDSSFDVTLEEKRNGMEVTQLSAGPQAALGLVRQLIDEHPQERSIVYLLSDFRAPDWENPAAVRNQLREIEKAGARVQLISAVRNEQPNLGIVELAPTEDTRAAGVPLFMNVSVKNFGKQAVNKVQLTIKTTYFDPAETAAATPDATLGKPEALPTEFIDTIGPGETVTRRVQVYFPEPGEHVVTAELPDDAIAADNRRWAVVDFPEGERVLVIDGDVAQANSYYLQAAFQPGQRANTGIRPDVQPASFLRDTTPETLAQYRVVYLLDVPRLDDRAVENLETFVRGGGGLAVFLGPDANISFYNGRLYNEGNGLMPMPLTSDDLLEPPLSEDSPDVVVMDHPLFSAFADERNPLIRLVTVERYFRTAETWEPAEQSTTQVIASLRNRQPLAVESTFGEGRVVAFTSTLAPQWNNWATNPSFVVVLLNLQSYLAASGRSVEQRMVGTPVELQMPADKYRPEVTFIAPGAANATRVRIDATAAKPEADSPFYVTSIGRITAGQAGSETNRSGVYEAWESTAAGGYDVRRFALNVEPTEGEVALADPQRLLSRLDPVKPVFRSADEFEAETSDEGGFNISLLVMSMLVGLLIGEQALAYFASYHPARGAVR
ncbi:MAG: BatA domain-containing protein [Planctomycetales bacterium]|nr:BatA domain-containing protein [Planctomycetales bacterium]